MTMLQLAEFAFLLKGLQWTIALSAIGLAFGAIAGLAIALARTSHIAALRRGTAAYIALFQGTPLLMQLFVTYYGLALIGLELDAWVEVAIGFTLHASAFLGEIWRGSIEAVPRGQTEAANALGLKYTTRLRKVVLPQALRISLPAFSTRTKAASVSTSMISGHSRSRMSAGTSCWLNRSQSYSTRRSAKSRAR